MSVYDFAKTDITKPVILNQNEHFLFGANGLRLACFRKNKNKTSGEMKYWHPDGTPYAIMFHRRGKATGIQLEYQANGFLASKKFIKKNRLTGPFQTYHANGNPQIVGWFKNNQRYGLWQEFDTTGNTTFKQTYPETPAT